MARKVTPHTTVLLVAVSAALLTSAAARASGTSVTITTNWDGTTNSWTSDADWSTTPYYPNNGSPTGTDYNAVINSSKANGYTVTLQ